MIPEMRDGQLPPGVHDATWPELVGRFGDGPQRQQLLDGLLAAARELRRCGCRTLYVDGSLVTAESGPRDFDGCWDATGVDLPALDPVLKTFDPGRAVQKAKYGGELFPAGASAVASGRTFMAFFQTDRVGQAKGIVALDLRTLP